MALKEINIEELYFNPFTKLGKEWALITSGDEKGYGTMTVSWGFMGVMWRKNVLEAVVRPSRNTFGYLESNDLFTVSFFDAKYHDALSFCGTHSGRDCDKAKETGLTPLFTDSTTAFEEAELVFVCRKVYSQDMDNSLLCEDIKSWYDNGEPAHKAFYGEILKVYKKA